MRRILVAVRMIIKITAEDIWESFVYYRKIGLHRCAFDCIRPNQTDLEVQSMLLGIAAVKYKPQIGDIIMLNGTTIGSVWDSEMDKVFKQIVTLNIPEFEEDKTTLEILDTLKNTRVFKRIRMTTEA
jgi:ethanolamine ammonia-lyase large subunit